MRARPYLCCLVAVWMAPLSVSACDLTSWSGVTASDGVGSTLHVGGPDGQPVVRRYSGVCAMTATAPGNFVTDDSPVNESTFFVRFYVLPRTSGGTATLYRAFNGAGTSMITVRFNGSAFEFATRGGYVASQPVLPSHWYSVQLSWTAGGTMSATVRGAGQAALPVVVTSAAQAADRIERASLGWVEGAATGDLTFDSYESRRSTPVPRLCRGNADANRFRNANDQARVRTEFLREGLAKGQPDCNEDGEVDSGDVVCLRNVVQAGEGDCDAFPNH